MSALDAFHTTWSRARATFGDGVPQSGDEFDGSGRFRQMQAEVEAAAPDQRWEGPAADAYGATNRKHAADFSKLAELDQRMAAEVNRSADVVSTGRRDLDQLRDWVTSMAATTPPDLSGERMRLVIAGKGISQISDIIRQRTGEMNVIGQRLRAIGDEYGALGGQG